MMRHIFKSAYVRKHTTAGPSIQQCREEKSKLCCMFAWSKCEWLPLCIGFCVSGAKAESTAATNLRTEASILINCRHPNIQEMIEYFENDHEAFLVTRLCQGGDLLTYMEGRGFKELDEARVRQIARGIAAAFLRELSLK